MVSGVLTDGAEGLTGKASIMASIEPVMATLFGLILFKEVPTIWGFAGMCLVVASIVLLNLKVKPEPAGTSKLAAKNECRNE